MAGRAPAPEPVKAPEGVAPAPEPPDVDAGPRGAVVPAPPEVNAGIRARGDRARFNVPLDAALRDRETEAAYRRYLDDGGPPA